MENFTDVDGRIRQRGIENEFLYVYKGDGTPARKAAGDPPSGPAMGVAAGAGNSDLGFHLFAVVYETDTGYLTAPGPEVFTGFTSVSTTQGFSITNVPVSPDPFVTKRHIVATARILGYNDDQDGYQFFFVPDGVIENNVDTSIVVSFFDIDLIDDASHLVDNFSEIPAGVTLTKYNNRLVTTTEFENESLCRLSFPGEPEAIDQVDGLIIVPLDGLPLTNAMEYRDVLYLFKQTRTWSSVDNGNEPSFWAGPTIVDNGLGAPVHGVAQVLDSGGVNVEMLLIADWSGFMMFAGRYARPELSWKIFDRWLGLDRDGFNNIQIMNDTINMIFYMTMPDRSLLMADYSDGLNAKDIKWCPWTAEFEFSTIALIRSNVLIVGAEANIINP